MSDLYSLFKQGSTPTRDTYRAWPLFGAGLENLGLDGKMIDIPMPDCGPDELIIRHDACGLCFSDIKVIRVGQSHPRIYRDMQREPVVLGHEVALTVIKVGENLKTQFKQGDRFILQAEIYVDGINYSYGYEFQGGLSEFNKIDMRIINGDDGSYLIPVNPQTGYAESALSEPWACVNAAYSLSYRSAIKNRGTTWFVGPEPDRDLTISMGFDADSHPATIALTNMDGVFGDWLRGQALELGIHIIEWHGAPSPQTFPDGMQFDDIILLNPSAQWIEKASPYLANHGIMVITTDEPLKETVQLDVGRIHYNRWLFIGGEDPDIAQIYQNRPIPHSALTPNGRVLFVGAGGPMGHMHVQRALQPSEKPSLIVCTDISEERLGDLKEAFLRTAQQHGTQFKCVNASDKETYLTEMAPFRTKGFNEIVILAPIPAVIPQHLPYLADGGVMNIFAGIPRGNLAEVDFNAILRRDLRLIGHSASSIEDMVQVLNQVEQGTLSTNQSVAAIGSLEAVPEGLIAVAEGLFPGKIVIYPHIRPLPLTSMAELKDVLPNVAAKLKNGVEWTVKAEQELLRTMLLPI